MLHSDVPKAPQGSDYLEIVTDMWLERCLHCTECVDPRAHPTSAPFRIFPIPGMSNALPEWVQLTSEGFESTIICSTAFRGVDLLHVSKAVKLIGNRRSSPLKNSKLIKTQVQNMMSS
jgi:DNA replication regulator DPB11